MQDMGCNLQGGGSYLLPVDVPKDDIDLLQRHAVSLESVLKALDNKAQLTVAVFDACREIPQIEALIVASTRSTGLGMNQYRGMGRVQSRGRSRVVAFSGAAGQLVKDGVGQNSPYTRELLNQLDVPGQEVGDIFRQVAYRFGQQYGGQQPEVLIQGVPPQHYYFTVKPWQAPVADRFSLTIKTSPANARIRILNIGPKYKDNIELKPGRYHIEVSLSGYARHTEWLTLETENKVHSVVLTALSDEKRRDRQNGIEMIRIDSGCFQMGSNNGDGDEKPVHRVCLNNGYYMEKYEVTQAQWQKIMGSNPSYFKCQQCPVEKVSWNDVQEFIRKLNRQSGLQYRLPTEAEWEYACRSGGREQRYCGGNSLGTLAWYRDNSASKTHPVGGKQANGLGLYDMSGNVWEWVSDGYDNDYYEQSPTNNPKGPSGGSYRVNRGGSWSLFASRARSAYRSVSPDVRSYNLGFRLARTKH